MSNYTEIQIEEKNEGRAEPGMRSELVVYVLWVEYDTHPVYVSQRRWRVYGYHEIHCESEMIL